ncbi:IclR family transcriptional regulator [Hoyosella subflava]|uniref:Transcriptional regulator n=1 Tax=Hoyosella subflava (strain DSM 45089 / JCM 17490 / NBRC 109087 / DQS3-9A1) TaxID=443218 RepID=F6EPM8_HOYSD|nr:IclR family transcriptional regulator [Hoyosella subflava]AEF39461.1 Transcriptional regulator [Hoyosella subflava DQS3-9A1]
MGETLRQPQSAPVDGRAKTVRSVDRALDVLELIATEGRLGVSEAAARLDVGHSTVARLIASLQQRGFIEESSSRGCYQMGFAVVRLAEATVAQSLLIESAQPECDRLAALFGATVNLAILDRSSMVSILECRVGGHVAPRTPMVKVSSAHATAAGKVLYSELSRAYTEQSLGVTFAKFTPRTIEQIESFCQEIATVRSIGWAAAAGELEDGLNSVAVPVRSLATGRIIAALCVSGPTLRLPREQFAGVAEVLTSAAGRIEER